VSTDYWPLPWYLRDYGRVGYFGRMSTSNEPVIIASEGQGAEMEATLGGRYQQVNSGFNAAGSYALRPGVNLLLYVQRDSLKTTTEKASN
jgi:predicted membrane-bound mannosyltransferase